MVSGGACEREARLELLAQQYYSDYSVILVSAVSSRWPTVGYSLALFSFRFRGGTHPALRDRLPPSRYPSLRTEYKRKLMKLESLTDPLRSPLPRHALDIERFQMEF